MSRKITREERLQNAYQAAEPIQNAKKKIVSAFMNYGKKYRVLRYPVLALLTAFLLLYNSLYHGIIYLWVIVREKPKPAKVIAGFLVFCMVVNSAYVPALAAENNRSVEGSSACEAHLSHDESCGYVEAVEAQPCQHVHGEECYSTVASCTHVHDESCYETVSELICGLEESSGDLVDGTEGHVHTEDCYSQVQNTVCTHVCSEESGCITRELNCQHTHDELCGYREAVEGQPCTHSCASCDGSEEERGQDDPAEAVTTPESGETVGTTPEEVVLPGKEPEETTLQNATQEIVTPVVEEVFEQSVVCNGIEISVSAPAGVFPAGAVLCVEMITNESDVSEIEQLVTEKKDETTAEDVVTVVEQSYSFDITIVDENGTEIEPDTSKGQVSVTFKNVGATEAQKQEEKELSVFYVSDDYAEAEEITHDVDTAEDSASITTEHFSIYTVVITSGEKKDTILHYYQGTSKASSYFTIYNGEQLARYRDLLNGYVAGTVTENDTFSTILVNSDDNNPMDGITGMGQATNMTVKDLNFSVKIMDDITVQNEWSPINEFPEGVSFDGAGHTITFTTLATNVVFDGTNEGLRSVLIRSNSGTIKHLVLKYTDKIYSLPGETESGLYATVTVRVDGQKAEIGEAITGAEALAASCDGVNYITLERDDDLAVYRTPLENLYDPSEEADPEVEASKEYSVYYVYEDENETISAATITINDFDAELNYLSVSYDLEGANTYSYVDNNGNNVYDFGTDGDLSENVMAAVRVDVNPDGGYEAQEDYRAVVKAAEGFEIPELSENVKVKYLDGAELTRGTDYSYTYDEENKLGSIWIKRDKITKSIRIEVHADKLEQKEYATIVLKTKGGTIANPAWEKSSDEEYTYIQKIYKGTKVTINLPGSSEISNINGSTAIGFEGWYYNDIGCSAGNKVSSNGIQTSTLEMGKEYVYYAKYTIAKSSDNNGTMWYSYASGKMDVRGYDSGSYIQTTFGNYGYTPYCRLGALPAAGQNEKYGGTSMSFPTSGDIFTKSLVDDNLYIAEVYTLDGNYVKITYIFENRGSSSITNFNFGLGSDVQISIDDTAAIGIITEGTAKYLRMSARDKNVFKAYIKGEQLGVDEVSRYWYGYYGGGSNTYNGQDWTGNVFNKGLKDGPDDGADKNYTTTQDSALAFSWSISSIPAKGIVTRSIKMGIGDTSSMLKLSATFIGGIGKFVDGSKSEDYKTVTSSSKQIEVLSDGRIKVNGSTIINVPVNTYGYDFAYWSYTNGSYEDNPAPEKFTGMIQADSTLYAIWVPHPTYSVINNSSVQKVNGSDNLLVPETLGNIVIENTTPGTGNADDTNQIIRQGMEVEEAAGNASNFTAILSLQGEDERYLLPDDIKITVKKDGEDFELSKGTGYTYEVYNNRRNAALTIYKQYITGTITITAIGYELPPVTATSITVETDPDKTISYGERAVFTAQATTSKNHVASYQWYIAPYFSNELDKVYWTYENQNGVPLQNGTFNSGDVLYDRLYSAIKATTDTTFVASGNPITISGANKATLRIGGLDVNMFSASTPGESMKGLQYCGYHVYCVVTSTRNITGQEIVAVSDTAELQVTKAAYPAPTGLEGSATTYNGSPDGSIAIEAQEKRPALYYKKDTEADTAWKKVTPEQLAAGEITGLAAGTYQFYYKADRNHTDSEITTVTVASGRDIVVTYRAQGCDNEALRTQHRNVSYNRSMNDILGGIDDVTQPDRAGYTFDSWSYGTESMPERIQEDTTVYAVYVPSVYKITLDSMGATNPGTTAIYEKYSVGFYQEEACTHLVNGSLGTTVPTRNGYNFLGYFTEADGGTQMINADGCLSENVSATKYREEVTLYAHWEEKPVDFNVLPGVNDPEGGSSGGDNPGTDPNTGVEVSIKPTNPGTPGGSTDPENPGTGEEDPQYNAGTSYDVTITNDTGKKANVIYIYSDGELKRALTHVTFDENNQYTFTLIPSEVGGGSITFVLGYVSPDKEDDTPKTDEEIQQEAEQQVINLKYTITYKEVNGSLTGADFSGTFLTTAPATGVKGVATVLPEATRTGYTFGGWYTAPRGTGRAITEIPASSTDDEVVVYAKWIAKKYTITLETNEGSYTDGYVPAEQYQHGDENVDLPDNTQITRDNYVFLGWFDNVNLVGDAVTQVDASYVGGVTYYAGWELLNTHTITLTDDGMDGRQYTLEGVDGYGYIENGIIKVYDGKEYRFKVSVGPAYKLKAVKANGKLVSGENGVYTISAVTDNITITVVTEVIADTRMNEDAVATILLSDGTTAYFETLAAAISYAANYGEKATIVLKENLEEYPQLSDKLNNIEIEAIAGNAYTIDLNGNTISGDSTMLIEDGAQVTLKDSMADGTLNEANTLTIENRGELTNEIHISEMLNLGIIYNYGNVAAMTQQDSETYDKSKFVNHGTIGTATLEHGYYVEEADPDGIAPAGLTGYHTIMNGNEYYVDFKDAVDIANASNDDATILILSTVDNHRSGSPIVLNNENGHAITVDWNGYDFVNGTLVTGGKVSFVNSRGSATCISEINSFMKDSGEMEVVIHNTGNLTIGDYVKVGGKLVNATEGDIKVQEKAGISGPVNNEGTFKNDGNITGIFTNEGDTTNKGTMNNVVQKDGTFDNYGDITTKIEMEGGCYIPEEGATPQVPDGAVAKSNTNPVTYYGTFKDAVEDANRQEPTGDSGEQLPFEITILDDIPDDRLGEAPIVLDPKVPVDINLNNHKLGDGTAEPKKEIQIGKDGGEVPATTDPMVTLKNEPENGEAYPELGRVGAPIKVEEGGSLGVDEDVTVKNVDNDGRLKVEPEGNVEKLTNNGDTDNNGKLGDVEQDGGKLTNGENGKITNLTQTGGNTENSGTIDKLNQNGGNTENKNSGTIGEADIQKGGYTGKEPNTLTGVDPADQAAGKVAMITPVGGGDPIYFVSLEDALEYAAGMDSEEAVTVTLLKNLVNEDVNFSAAKTPVTPVILDLNGHNLTDSASIHTGEGTNLTIQDNKPEGEKGSVSAPVTNDGHLIIEQGISVDSAVNNTDKGTLVNKGNISGAVTNAGDFVNRGDISGTVENTGNFDNDGEVTGGVAQKGGTYTNEDGAYTNQITQTGGNTINKDTAGDEEGGIGRVDLQSGSYEGAQPGTPINNAAAKIGEKLYGDLESAVQDANQSEEDVTIELTKDASIPDDTTLVIDNENGKNITIDLKGHDITGGDIQIGTEEGEGGSAPDGGKVTFKDTSTPGEDGKKGTVSSDIAVKKEGDLTLDEGVTATGDLDNAGKTINNGTIAPETPNSVTNTGDMTNNGNIDGKVEQKDGTLTNGDHGTIEAVEQTGGTLDNKNGGIDSATVSGGEFKGEPAENMNYNGAKVAVITQNPDGTTKTTYYPTLDEALNNTEGNATLKLLDDVKDENSQEIVINKPGITIDLNGHEIGSPSTVTITENATDTKLTDTKPVDSPEGQKGSVTVPLENKGELTIDKGIKVSDVTNSGKLENEGEIENLINTGDTTNSGTVSTLSQKAGSVKNETEGTIGSVDEFTGGSFAGKQPQTPMSDSAAVAQIGDKLYADLASAIEDANQSSEDVTIKVLQDTSLPDATNPGTPVTEIGNENGKKITLDLGGNTVGGGPVKVKAPGTTEITDSNLSGAGALKTDVAVDPAATLVIDETATIKGDIDNKGHTENKGTVTGDVKNDESGSFHNQGVDSYIGGDVKNAGDMDNEGVVSGEVDNTGELHNSGNIDNNVTNRGNGTFDNDGNVNGQLENKDNATTDNTGNINQVKQSGGEFANGQGGDIGEYLQTGGDLKNGSEGTITQLNQTGGHSDNEGIIENATISDLRDFSGKLPESGLDGANISITYPDENGNPKTEYYPTLEEAIEAARAKNPDHTKDVTVSPVTTPLVIDGPITIPEGVTLDIPEGSKVVIAEGGKLDNQGDIHIGKDSELEIQPGGKLTNSGKLSNQGEIDNLGSLVNKQGGSIENSGDISSKAPGTMTNNGSLDNKNGSLNGDTDANGSILNNGSIRGGTITGPLENGTTGTISESQKLSGQIVNKGKIVISSSEVLSDALIENLPGSEFIDNSSYSNDNDDDTDIEEETKEPSILPTEANQTDKASQNSTDIKKTSAEEPAAEVVEDTEPSKPAENGKEEANVSGEQKPTAEVKTIVINSLKEAEGIQIEQDEKIELGAGTISLEVVSEAGKVKGDLKEILQACFTEEEMEQVINGEDAVTRVTVIKMVDNVPQQDEQVIQAEVARYAEKVKGIQLGKYIDITVECKVGNSDWRRVHELDGELLVEIQIPEDILADGRSYYILRNHNGECTFLEDLDEEHTTITIATDRFSTYAILFTDIEVAEQNAIPWVLAGVGILAFILIIIFLLARRRKQEQ